MSSISWRTWVIGCSAPSGCGSPGSVTSAVSRSSAAPISSASSTRGALVERRLDRAPRQVGRLAHLAAPLRRQAADAREHGRERAAPAGVGARAPTRAPRGCRARRSRRAPRPGSCEVGLAHRPVRVSDPRGRRPLAHRLGQQRGARRGDVQRLGALGLRDRDAHRSRGRRRGPRAPGRGRRARRRGPAPSAGSGRPPRAARRPAATAATTAKPSRVARSAGVTPSSSGSAKVAPIAARTARGWKASAEPGPEREPVGAERRGGAHEGADVARVGDAGQVEAERGREARRRGSCARAAGARSRSPAARAARPLACAISFGGTR